MSPSKHTHTHIYIYNIIKIIKTFEVKNYIIIISSILKKWVSNWAKYINLFMLS